jgi:hypothetical protein
MFSAKLSVPSSFMHVSCKAKSHNCFQLYLNWLLIYYCWISALYCSIHSCWHFLYLYPDTRRVTYIFKDTQPPLISQYEVQISLSYKNHLHNTKPPTIFVSRLRQGMDLDVLIRSCLDGKAM